MRLQTVGPRKSILAGWSGMFLSACLWVTGLQAQTPPEMLRINVIPSKPGIRAIILDKKYKPIINRDDDGVVVDTLGSSDTPPPCETKLEVTLENSRVLHRTVNICTGNILTVDVESDGKPGNARVIQGVAGKVGAPQQPATDSTPGFVSAPANVPPVEAVPAEDGVDRNATPDALEPSGTVTAPTTNDAFSKNGVVGQSLPELGSEPSSNFEPEIPGGESEVPPSPSVAENILVTPSEHRVWAAKPGNVPGALTTLVHGVLETDDVDFFASCPSQSGRAMIVFSQTPATLREGEVQSVRISSGTFSGTYNAIGSSPNNQYGQSFPQVAVPTTDPVWDAMIRDAGITIEINGLPSYSVSLKGSANPVRLFVATCAEPQQVVNDGALSGDTSVEPGADAPCSELGRIRSIEGKRPGQIVFRNKSQQPIDVHWIDYSGSERSYARLQPGQILEQQTFVTHAWLVRGVDGSCRGIYITRTPFREVVITGGSQPPLTSGPLFGTPTEPAYPSGPVPPASVGAGRAGPGSAGGMPRVNGTVANYMCTAGIDLQVTFSADGQTATVAEMGYGVVTLTREAGGSTMRYASGQGHVLQGQLENATWRRPGLRDVFCARKR